MSEFEPPAAKLDHELLTPTAKKLLSRLKPGLTYNSSGLGFVVFGRYRQNEDGTPSTYHRSAQGSALAVGKYMRELYDKGILRHENNYHTLSGHGERVQKMMMDADEK